MSVLFTLTGILIALSCGVTAVKLSTESGGQWLFTMIGLVLFGAAAPYLAARAVMRRVQPAWALATGWAAVIFGVADVAIRTWAFYVPNASLGGGVAFWLPISAVAAIPFMAVVAHTFLGVEARSREAEREEQS